MIRPFALSRTLLILAMVGLMGLAALGFRAQERDVDGYREASQESIHWSAAQVEVELARFVSTLSRYSLGDEQVTDADVRERFDILWSRTGLFRSGTVGERLRAYDKEVGVIAILIAQLQVHEPAIMAIRRHDAAGNTALIHKFVALQERLRRLSVRVLSGEERRFALVRSNLKASGRLTLLVSAAAIVLAAVLIGVMLIEGRRYERTIREIAELAAQAEAANNAKARFLTMMSHELRTPMNGVMGLIALAKQTGMNDKQLRLIEQAERSGVQMISLLGDILDFSDLQTNSLEVDQTAFEVKALGAGVNGALADSVKRKSVRIGLKYKADLPEFVVGDVARLRQILTHFCAYLIEVVGSQDMVISFAHDGARLVCEINVEVHDEDRPGWQPEAIFGREADSHGDFASDSLGPMIGRGLLELMGGTVKLKRPGDQRASLFISVPAQPVAPNRDYVRIETSSDTINLLVHALFDEGRWHVWDKHINRARVDAVLLDVTGIDEPDRVGEMRAQHPGARIVAMGEPKDPALFDALTSLPPTGAVLSSLLSEKTVRSDHA